MVNQALMVIMVSLTVKTVVDTINNSGWKGDVTGNTVGDHTATIVKPGTTVNFGAGKNFNC